MPEEHGLALQASPNAEGIATFTGLPASRRAYVLANHPAHGARVVPVDLPESGTLSIDVVLEDTRELRLRLLDGDVPLSGVAALLRSPYSILEFVSRNSDASGQVSMGRVAPGDYRVAVDHPGVWPAVVDVRFDGSEQPIPIQLRRLGDLRVLVKDVEGVPVSGASVALTPVESPGSVADWIRTGLVSCEPRTLLTGADGASTLKGLPRGPYLLHLVLPTGATSQHSVTVAPKQLSLAEIRVGD